MTANEGVAAAERVAVRAVESESGLRTYLVRLTPNRGLTPFAGIQLFSMMIVLFMNSSFVIVGEVIGEYRLSFWLFWFLVVCCCGIVGLQFLWRRFGYETIRIMGDELTVERRLGGWARVRTYRLDEIDGFRGGMALGGNWNHMAWPNWQDDLAWGLFQCPCVRFRVAGRRWEQRFAVGMRPDDVVRAGKAVAEFAGKPWGDEFVGTPLR